MKCTLGLGEEWYFKGIFVISECYSGALDKESFPTVYSLIRKGSKVKMEERELQFKTGYRLFEGYFYSC